MAEVTGVVFSLYEKHGNVKYGEGVNQLEHALQCAMAAEKEGADVPTILGALLHDVGHLAGLEQDCVKMVSGSTQLGIQLHDVVGERFLCQLGVPEEVWKFTGGHVQAKRYLTYIDADYYNKLSEASKMTLVQQGGPMTAEEAERFRKNSYLKELLQMRNWDEAAKVEDLEVEPLSKYKYIFQQYMEAHGSH